MATAQLPTPPFTPPSSYDGMLSNYAPDAKPEKRNSPSTNARAAYPSPAPSTPSSPVLSSATPAQYTPRSNRQQMQGIEAALSAPILQIPQIPPFNPHGRHKQSAPSPDLSSPSNRPVTRSSTATEASSRSSSSRPASAAITPYTPEPVLGAPSRTTNTTGGRSRNERASHQIGPAVLPHTQGNQGIGIFQGNGPAGNAGSADRPFAAETRGRPKIYFGPYQLLQTLGEGEFGKVKLGVRGDA